MDPTSHVELKCYLFIYFCDRTKEEFATQRMNEKGGGKAIHYRTYLTWLYSLMVVTHEPEKEALQPASTLQPCMRDMYGH